VKLRLMGTKMLNGKERLMVKVKEIKMLIMKH
jgi:hypothetical protein